MKVSIITISFNSALTIEETLKSVKNQSYNDIEHIIIDGKSNDDTINICNNYPHLVKIICEKDKGVYDAFNKGLKIASGDVIGFLNSDDTFADKESLKKIVDGFDSETHAVFGNLNFYNKENKVIRKWISKPFKKGAFEKAWMPPHPTFYCRKNIYDKYGYYDDSFMIAGDFELMLRFIECRKIKTKFLDQNLIKMKSGGISNSGFKSKIKILKEEFKAFKMNKIKLNRFNYILNKAIKIREFF